MFAVPGLLALIVVEYLRPQEYLPALATLPLLHVATALGVIGWVVDLRLGISRLERAPHLVLTILFSLWCIVTLLARAPDQVLTRAYALLVPIAIYALVAHGIQSFRMLQVVCATLLAIGVALSAIGVEQGLAPYGCHKVALAGGQTIFLSDGRLCKERNECERSSGEPGADYVCEKAGLLGTLSVQGRVRFRGTLQDPNELSLVLGIAVPFAFAFLDRRRSLPRWVLVIVTCILAGLCALFTMSRGGQLVFLAVLAVYFVRRFGVRRGIAAGLLLSLPILVLGGRSGAEESTAERINCWWVGLHLFAASPGFGVGFGQFLEHHYQTAHNSFILAAAELGVPGMLLFTSILYVAVKIPVSALRAELAPVGKTWAIALLASLVGLFTGSLFLSFAYKDVFWLYLGLTGVLYHCIRRHKPGFRVSFGAGDLGLVSVVDVALLVAHGGYTGWKLGW
jgi:hypothetical protein